MSVLGGTQAWDKGERTERVFSDPWARMEERGCSAAPTSAWSTHLLCTNSQIRSWLLAHICKKWGPEVTLALWDPISAIRFQTGDPVRSHRARLSGFCPRSVSWLQREHSGTLCTVSGVNTSKTRAGTSLLAWAFYRITEVGVGHLGTKQEWNAEGSPFLSPVWLYSHTNPHQLVDESGELRHIK